MLTHDKKFQFFTNLDPKHSCALTTVGIQGIPSGELAGWLLSKHSIFVTTIKSGEIDGIRVSPNIYSTVQEVDRFSEAMVFAAKNGIA